MALRLETLYRSGLLEQASQELAKMPAAAGVVATLAARNDIGLGKKEQGCATAQNAGPIPGDLPKPSEGAGCDDLRLLRGDRRRRRPAAGLAAEMAREEGQKESAGLEALDAISVHASPRIAANETVSLLDYRLIEAAGGRYRTRRASEARRTLAPRRAGARPQHAAAL